MEEREQVGIVAMHGRSIAVWILIRELTRLVPTVALPRHSVLPSPSSSSALVHDLEVLFDVLFALAHV